MGGVKTRSAYMAHLRWALMWRLPPQEAHEVWEEYDSFFTSGLAEGKTEAELCVQFGTPREVAQALRMEEGFPRGGGISWQALLTAVLFLCLAFSYLTYYNGNPFLSQRINGLGALLACLVPALCLIWRGGILLLPPLKRWEIRQLALLHGSALMLWLISIGISIASVPFYLLYLRTGVHTTPMFVFYHVLNLCRLLTLALLVLSLLAAWQWSARFFTAAAHFQGAMTSLLCANETISCINPLGTRNYAMFMPPVVLYGMGLLSVAVVGLLVWREGRRFQRGRTV